MNMIDCINAIETESKEFKRLLSEIDGVENVSYPRISYACQGIDMTAVVRRNKKEIDVGVAYRADGNKKPNLLGLIFAGRMAKRGLRN